jgi:DNA replication protein DnaC
MSEPAIDRIRANLNSLKENVVFGSPGVGKTHLAAALSTIAASHRAQAYYLILSQFHRAA